MMPMEEEAFYRCRVEGDTSATGNRKPLRHLSVRYLQCDVRLGFHPYRVGYALATRLARAIIRDGYQLIDTMIVGDNEALVASRFLAEHPPEQGILRYLKGHSYARSTRMAI